MQPNNTPLLAVYMITYNHGKFITEAVESVMMQQTSFDFKLYIGEDCSPDNTREICIALQKKYPGKIELFLNPQNLGASKNAKQIFDATFKSGAKYIAMLEGDDYWSDPKKLQKQFDFLENNLEYAMCFHRANILTTTGKIVKDFITSVPEDHETLASIARYGNYIHTPSVVFRNVITIPSQFYDSPIGDFFLYMLVAEHGKIKYMPETMCIYRHGVGFFSEQKGMDISLNVIRFYSCLLAYLKDDSIKKIIFDRQMAALDAYNVHAAYKYSSNAYLAKEKSLLDVVKITARKIFSKN